MFDDINPAAESTATGSKRDRMHQSSEYRRKKSRQSGILGIIAVGAATLILILIFCAIVFRVNKITVAGETGRYSAAEISAAADSGKYSNMIFLDTAGIIKRVEQRLPYLDGVTVSKNWKNQTISVNAVYSNAEFAILRGNKYILLNRNCKVLETDLETKPAGVADLLGLAVSYAEPGRKVDFTSTNGIDNVIAVVTMMRQAGITGITVYDLQDINDVHVYMIDGGEISIGSISGISKTKTSFLAELYSRRKAENRDEGYLITIVDNKNATIRDVERTEPETEPYETVTDENGETVTNENGEPVTVIPGEEPSTEAATEPETTPEPPEETTKNPLASFFSDKETTSEAGTVQTETTVPGEQEGTTKNALAGFFASTDD